MCLKLVSIPLNCQIPKCTNSKFQSALFPFRASVLPLGLGLYILETFSHYNCFFSLAFYLFSFLVIIYNGFSMYIILNKCNRNDGHIAYGGARIFTPTQTDMCWA